MALGLGGCATPGGDSGPAADKVRFEWFDYVGRDPVFEAAQAGPDSYRNPILGGFYPDPSIVRVGEDYYLVNSTFSFFPGIPIFHSRDLVHWTQIGNVIDRQEMLDFSGISISSGVFAPAISYHDGLFYVVNTCVRCGGNYVVTAERPEGPWLDPIFTPEVGGIDASLFFDDDGKVYILNNDAPEGEPRYNGHRAIWIREVDPKTFQSITPQRVLLDGGAHPENNPIWIEGPHLYKINGRYYLYCAEGGTGDQHSQVVLRSDSIMGPYEVYPGNPILTQRHLDSARPNPVTSTGHSDLVETQNGEWWAVFLGTRPYLGNFYNTGRETFLMPVKWRDGWPIITEGDEKVPYLHARPNLPADTAPLETSGNLHMREDFDGAALGPAWLSIRTPRETWSDLSDGALTLNARADAIGGFAQPSFVGWRQQNMYATVSTLMQVPALREGEQAGLVAFQNDEFYYFLGVVEENGARMLQVRARDGHESPVSGAVLASAPLEAMAGAPLFLRIDADGGRINFSYALTENAWRPLLSGADGAVLSTERAGGIVGTIIGPYAYAPPAQ